MSDINKIVYVGPLNPGGTCLQRMESLRSLGCQVIGVDVIPKAQNLFLYKVVRRLYAPLDFSGTNRSILLSVASHMPEVLWIDKGLIVARKTLEAARKLCPGVIIVSYSPDDMLNPKNQSRQYLSALPEYDVHVTTKSYNVDELRGLGARDVYFIDNAFCPENHRPIDCDLEERLRLGGGVGFIGTYESDRAAAISHLAKSGHNVKVWGLWPHSWAMHAGVNNVQVMGRELVGLDYAKAIGSFDVNLCFLRKENRDLQTTRSIEIPACGGFMLAERTREHVRLFKEGVEAEYFESNKELADKVKFYLANPEKRKRIAAAGYRKCIDSGYSNASRLNEIIKYVMKTSTRSPRR